MREKNNSTNSDKFSVSIVIITWNGRDLLERFFPSVIAAFHFYDGKKEIIVVDNGSSDGTELYLRENYPEVKLFGFSSNRGFSSACNLGVKEAQGDVIVLLNNDMLVEKDFLSYLLEHFTDERIFGVRPGLKWIDDKTDFDFNSFSIGLRWKFGMITLPMLKIPGRKPPFYISYVSGGAGAFARKKWLELGGFDELFNPIYYEDVDISYRAWKRGWLLLYEPRSRVYHAPNSTIKRYFTPEYIEEISERNRYFLIWKNISDPLFLCSHLFSLPFVILNAIFSNRSYRWKGLLLAFRKIKKIVTKRNRGFRFFTKTDRQIFKMFSLLEKNGQDWV